jgi:hypothetical protein
MDMILIRHNFFFKINDKKTDEIAFFLILS